MKVLINVLEKGDYKVEQGKNGVKAVPNKAECDVYFRVYPLGNDKYNVVTFRQDIGAVLEVEVIDLNNESLFTYLNDCINKHRVKKVKCSVCGRRIPVGEVSLDKEENAFCCECWIERVVDLMETQAKEECR